MKLCGRGAVVNSRAYRRYVLFVMTVVFALNYMDRCLINLLVQPIKVDLKLSDTEVGFLTGIVFGLFYATLGIPIARWADRGNRAKLTAGAIGIWGATVMSCLLVRTFGQIIFARVAAGVGEAGCMPPTYSLIGDYFPAPSERTRAMSIYWLGGPVSALIAFSMGGWLSDMYGWRVTFFLFGVPGLLIAVLVWATVVDPRATVVAAGAAARKGQFIGLVRNLWRHRASRDLNISVVLLFTMGLGLNPWYAAFLIRSHAMSMTDVGIVLGLTFGVGGIGGVLLSARLAGRKFAGNDQKQLRWCSLVAGSMGPIFIIFLFAPNKYLAVSSIIPYMFAFYYLLGPIFSLMQRLVPDDVRATSMSVVMLLANLIGMGVGPQIVGVVSDVFRPLFGADSLRIGMLLMSFTSLWASFHLWRAGSTIREGLDELEMEMAKPQTHCESLRV